MSNKTKIHWPTAFATYFVAGLLLSIAGFSVRHHSLAAVWSKVETGTLTVFIVFVVLFGVGSYLYHKIRLVRWAVLTLKKFWHVLLAWAGAGLSTFGIAEAVHGAGSGSAIGALLAGPLAFLIFPSMTLVALVFVVWTAAFVEMMHETKIASHKDGKGSVIALARNARRTVSGAEYASVSEPEDAHFVETTEPIASYVISENDLAKRISFGVAHLAEALGKKKQPVEVGLPIEGSALFFGAPGSGKTLMGHRMMLNTQKEDPEKGILATKWIVTSIKARDIAGVVTPYFRSLGIGVQMWDLTGKTSKTDMYGDPVRWAPNSSCPNYDRAKRMAKRIVLSGRDSEAQGGNNKFWLEQCITIVSCALLASNLRRASHEMTLRWAKTWNDHNAIDVEQILDAHGEADGAADALRDWEEVRSSVLEKRSDGTWVERAASGENTVTGNNLKLTLSGLMSEIATQAAYDATVDPKFVPREWVRAEGSSVLFLIGNMREEGMTRSLFAPALGELLTEAAEYASEQDDERHPCRVIIFADELANLAPIEDLSRWFATNRSARIQFVAVFQSYAQAESVYSPAVARILLDASAAVVVLSGVNDPDLIRDLNTMGGSKRVELNDGNVTTHALIEGQQLMSLRAPNPKTGKPGGAIVVMTGGVAEIDVPLWTAEKRYDNRGTVMPQHRESTDDVRKKRDPWGQRRDAAREAAVRCKDWAARLWSSHSAGNEIVPAARPLVPHEDDADGRNDV